MQGEQGETGNRTIWGDGAVYSGSQGSLKTGALRGWICAGLQLGDGGTLGNLMRQMGAGTQANTGVVRKVVVWNCGRNGTPFRVGLS